MATLAVTVGVGYFLGSIPFGLIIGLLRGIDVRTVGSKNIGATNVFRTVGKPWGVLAFVLDFAKGLGGALLAPHLGRMLCGEGVASVDMLALTGGIAAVVGHTWPLWLKFRGGKGVATSAGMLAAIAPIEVGIAFVAWLLVVAISRFVSLASIIAAITLASAVWMRNTSESNVIPIAVSMLAVIVIWRHRANIKRLIAGTENRF